MKRAWLWLLAIVGSVVAIIGLFVFDTVQRAARAIETEEARLRDDIAAYRARWPAAKSPNLGLEAGHDDQRFAPPIRAAVAWMALQNLERAERDSFECGYARHEGRCVQDMATLAGLRQALTSPELRRADLQKASLTLQQMPARRVTVADLIEAEHVRDRAELLKNFRNGTGSVFLTGRPGWKECFSWRILVVKALRELEERKKELMRLQSDSLSEWEAAAKAFGNRVRVEGAYTRSGLCSNAANLIESERQSLLYWRFTQVATRLALFEAQNGRAAETLEDLGLDVPTSPYDGKPFEYRDGVLKTANDSLGPPIGWLSPRR